MDSTEVTLFFDQPKVSALQSILAEDGTTLTEKLREYFQFLYGQLVPAEQQTAIATQMIEDNNSGIQVKGAAMDREAFAAYLNSIRPESDYAAKIWWQWAKELEEFDSSHGERPAGEYKTAEMFLNEFADRLHTIQEIHGDEIAGQMISLAEISACPFPWEMKLAAEHLAGGGKVEDIPEMEEAGTLEDFSEDLPPQEDGIQMPPM